MLGSANCQLNLPDPDYTAQLTDPPVRTVAVYSTTLLEFGARSIAFVYRSVQNPPAVIGSQFPPTTMDGSGRDDNACKTAQLPRTLHSPPNTVGYILCAGNRSIKDDIFMGAAEVLDGAAHHVPCHPLTTVIAVDLLSAGIGLWRFGSC
ncbi:hypothetical protein B5807_02613 [Epicoccum nigrum]|uniref:Uncharacterized protein n=1 Tax=Epicoccum nigrum TaxID=105696 RepID=A0A1Y2MB86_EPING|nr:hypothetical protein B5807_02613 [Epicoccum nigrum]